ncbi:MAG TPA: hypothetical protein VGV67_09905 [Solirubrobacteraceae bacterium]|nr:hypothetical protein [Solirubrobacteraceae bacterium]
MGKSVGKGPAVGVRRSDLSRQRDDELVGGCLGRSRDLENMATNPADRHGGSRDPSSPLRRLALSKTEAAETLGVSVDFFDEHVVNDLRIIGRGRRRLIPLHELERWIEANARRTL